MELRPFARTGVQVSPLCLGAMMFGGWGESDHDKAIRIIDRALDEGINFIDTADVYSGGESEIIVGEAGITLIQLAIAFVLRHPAVTAAIIGPRTMEHLESQLAGVDIELSDDVLDRIDKIVPPGTTINPADSGWVSPALQASARRR
jgi:aryl-alcohol dehydrogenase-like predicted oxidoreductase